MTGPTLVRNVFALVIGLGVIAYGIYIIWSGNWKDGLIVVLGESIILIMLARNLMPDKKEETKTNGNIQNPPQAPDGK